MKVLRVFFAGLIYGWLLRWVLDKIFLEDKMRILADENALLRQRVISLEAVPRVEEVRPSPRTTPASLPVEQVQPVAPMETGPVPPHRDDLKLIKGVGPVIEKKLNDVGIYTFDQMSRLTSTELQAILGTSNRNLQNVDHLISQAKKYAEDGPKG